MIVVADSSPLIAFALLNKLGLLEKVFSEIHIPEAVHAEILVWDKPGREALQVFSKDRVYPVSDKSEVDLLLKDLDLGESEAIIYAVENNYKNILIDEYKGRRIARDRGLNPIGTIATLLQAKKIGEISDIKSSLDMLIENEFRIAEKLYLQALRLAGESKE